MSSTCILNISKKCSLSLVKINLYQIIVQIRRNPFSKCQDFLLENCSSHNIKIEGIDKNPKIRKNYVCNLYTRKLLIIQIFYTSILTTKITFVNPQHENTIFKRLFCTHNPVWNICFKDFWYIKINLNLDLVWRISINTYLRLAIPPTNNSNF